MCASVYLEWIGEVSSCRGRGRRRRRLVVFTFIITSWLY